jgi:ATP-binding cassette subfamily B protein
MKLIIDDVAAAASSVDRAAVFERAAVLIVLAGGVATLAALCRTIGALVGDAQAQVVTDHMHDILHAKSVEVDLEYYENPQYYDALHRAQQEAPLRPTRIVNGLTQLALGAFSLVAIAGLLISFHWGFALVLFVAASPGLLVRFRYAGKLHTFQRSRTPKERLAWYFHWLLTGDIHAKEIRLFDLGPEFTRRFSGLRKDLRRERLRISVQRSKAELVTHLCSNLAVFGSYAFIAYQTINGSVSLGGMVMFYQAFQRSQDYFKDVLSSLAGLYEDNLFLSSLFELLDMKRKVAGPANPKPIPRPMKTGIRFADVGFQYPSGTAKVLEDIDLAIRPGQVVALVGENGSGKTTLIKLLCRLYDPTNGTITIDGIDLREFDVSKLRRESSVIFQDYARYQMTARENIRLGDVELPLHSNHIEATARLAGAHHIISRLPRGYETRLGKAFADGEELSIGEWQKIALARAFLRDAQIIVLDEPTSAMDARSEYEIFQRFRQLAEGRTAILISHRLSTVRMADCIYVLDGGRIVESGPHEELVHYGGMYARLFETQAQNYR